MLLPVFPFIFINFIGCNKFFLTKLFGSKTDNSSNKDNKSKFFDNTTCKDTTKMVVCVCLKSLFFIVLLGSLIMFMYIFSVIVSYTIYLFFYITYFMCLAQVTKTKENSTYVVFIFEGFFFFGF